MKKVFLASLTALALLASCTGNQKKAEVQAEEEVSYEQEQLEEYIQVQMDSLASEFKKMESKPFIMSLKNGEIALTDEEKAVAPEYLLAPSATDGLVTLSQKYRAVSMLFADKIIADAYGMNTDSYQAAITKLVADIDDPAFKTLNEANEEESEPIKLIEDFYNEEKANNRVNFFWETTTALLIEELYVVSHDPSNKFIECFDDQAADNVTYRIALFMNALNDLKDYRPELAQLNEAIQPLSKLNAVSADQFKQQVADMSKDIKVIRESLLK